MKPNLPAESAPTMIIPSGTQIEVDAHGQLSIRTPGNLVIQNSGSYGTIESLNGSIRIEPDVQVEAVSVRCQQVCYVQGSLTAWKVKAQSIELEEAARAHIILQETERLEVGKQARLVGNFSSEKELFLLFSRFAKQLRSMPFYFDRREELDEEGDNNNEIESPSQPLLSATDNGGASSTEAKPKAGRSEADRRELPDSLFFALVLLEREGDRAGNGPTTQRVLEELIKLLRGRDLEALRHTYQTLFERIVEPAEDLRRAEELIRDHFAKVPSTS